MDLGLQHKKALVTGSTAGIGFAIAESLAREGASVYINGRTQERVDRACEKIVASYPQAHVQGVAADVATKEGVEKLLNSVPAVDILINNFGIYEEKPFEEITDEEWIRFFMSNVMSGVRLSRALLGSMKAHNWGRIIFISSESAVHIPVEMIHYGMTKTAQLALARGLAEMTAGTGITVNSILPGPTFSEGVERFIQQMAEARGKDTKTVQEEFFKTARPTSLLQRFETIEEIASLVTFIASPLASAVTGAAIRAEGGIIRSIV